MPNLNVIHDLRLKYKKSRTKMQYYKEFKEENDNLEKALSNHLAELGPAFTRYFDFGLPADVSLLFIDVCNFSTRFSEMNGEQIGHYFDEYYQLIFPIIYEYGGEVDKILGDGIICVFGPPFLSDNFQNAIDSANKAAKEIINQTINTKFSSKIAFHAGTINYYKNKTGFYNEFTIIGKTLTELFRLESISENECINYFDDSPVRAYFKTPLGDINYWSHYGKLIGENQLPGVDYPQFFRIFHPKKNS